MRQKRVNLRCGQQPQEHNINGCHFKIKPEPDSKLVTLRVRAPKTDETRFRLVQGQQHRQEFPEHRIRVRRAGDSIHLTVEKRRD
ncbi:hypothetical protein KKG55_02405 [Candidatus Micrarchaeota archaeon]|nr:hypothetical protein [Candidatus Micrarchaeota archaeon]